MEPNTSAYPHAKKHYSHGMTKRDWIATKMMQALVQKCSEAADAACVSLCLAEDAYKLADALIEESQKKVRLTRPGVTQ